MRIQCERCGTEFGIGDWPFCHGNPSDHGKPAPYRPFVPYVDEHIATEPTLITSHHHRKQVLKRSGLDFRGRKVGMPGCEI